MSPELIKKMIERFGTENVMTFIIDNSRRITFNQHEFDDLIASGDFVINYEDAYLEKHEIINGLDTVIIVPMDHIQTMVFYDKPRSNR